MIDWRIYYSDGTFFDSSMGEPKDAPPHGVIVIVERDPVMGRAIISGWNWYYHTGEAWWGSDVHGLLDRLMHNLPTQAVKQGRMATTDIWRDTIDRAVLDEDFPLKSAINRERERPFQKVGW